MATSVNIVRVKRKVNDSHTDVLVVSLKKRKTEDDQQQGVILQETLKFAGTSYDLNEDVAQLVTKAQRKKKLEKEYKRHEVENVSKKLRTKQLQQNKLHRLKIVTERRGIQQDSNPIEKKSHVANSSSETPSDCATSLITSCNKSVKILDVEDDTLGELPPISDCSGRLTCNSLPMISEPVAAAAGDHAQYVYDIYYTHASSIDFHAFERDLVVECSTDEGIAWDTHSDDGQEFCYDDEDDENDEDNWRNDYPDEDSMYNFHAHDYASDEDAETNNFTNLIHDKLKITDSDDELSDEKEHVDSSFRNPNSVWTSNMSYDRYKRRVMCDLDDEDYSDS